MVQVTIGDGKIGTKASVLLLLPASAMLMWAAGCASAPKRSDSPAVAAASARPAGDPAASAMLENAKTLYDDSQYRPAMRLFRKLSDSDEYDATYAEEASFYVAEVHYARHDYVDAYYAYEQLLKDFPHCRFYDTAVEREYVIGAAFCTGKASTFWKRKGWGTKVLLRALEHRPFGRFAAEARMIAGDYYLETSNYDDAQLQYDLIISEYPDSKEARIARYRRALALYHNVQGNRYDSAEADKAIQALNDARRLFEGGEKSSANDELLTDIQAKLHDLYEIVAKENYDLGRFFMKNKNKKAAAAYFNAVIKETPDTSYVDLARRQLDGIRQD